jgi:uncharacterized membrane protein YcfT
MPIVAGEPVWLVTMTHELSVTTGLDIWYPRGQQVIWMIIIVIVLVARASRLGRAVTDLLEVIADLG